MVFVLVFSSCLPAFAMSFSDVQNHWAKEEISKWADEGIVNGAAGKFKPDESITRAELAVIIDRIFNYQMASQNSFKDLPQDWYTEAILKNNAKGVLLGYDKQVRPLDKVTRQEAIIMLCKAFSIQPTNYESMFSDYNNIPEWSVNYVNAMYHKGYITGRPDGGFYPKEMISRAEIVKIIDTIIGGYYSQSGDYSNDVKGMVIVNTKDVVLKNMTIEGNIIIAEGVGNGDFTMDSVIVKGEMYIYGGGEHSIKLYNTNLDKVILGKKDSKVRIYSDGSINNIVVNKEAQVIIDGALSVGDITINDNSNIEIRSSVKVDKVNLDGKDVNAVFDGEINKLTVEKEAANTKIKGIGRVKKVEYTGQTVKIDGVSSVSNKPTTPTKDKSDDKPSRTSSGSSSSSSSNNSSSGNTTTDNTTKVKQFEFTMKSTFIGSPTALIKVYKDGEIQNGYTLYVDGKKVASDSDQDGEITTIKNYFNTTSVIEYVEKNSSTKHKLVKK